MKLRAGIEASLRTQVLEFLVSRETATVTRIFSEVSLGPVATRRAGRRFRVVDALVHDGYVERAGGVRYRVTDGGRDRAAEQ